MGRLKKVAGEGRVLMKDEDNLVAVKPAEPLAGVDGAEGSPKLKQCTVAPAGGGRKERGGGMGDTAQDLCTSYVISHLSHISTQYETSQQE